MYDQTQSSQPFGMGGGNSSSSGFSGGGLQEGQSDEASASRRLRVRVAGTALFTVGIAALGYSMVDKGAMGKEQETPNPETPDPKPATGTSNVVVASKVEQELPLPPGFLTPQLDNSPIVAPTNTAGTSTTGTSTAGTTTPPPPPPPPVHAHIISHDGLHDFSGCGSFSQAFAHARAELGGPGEIFIFHGKPYTTTYKHEAEEGGHVHLENGFEVEMVLRETPNGGKIIAADTDKDGKADKWYYENNDMRCELIDIDGDGNFDSFINADGQTISLEEPVEPEPSSIPAKTYDIVSMDNVEFLAYGEPGKYTELIGEYDGKFLYYKDTDGDGKLDHAAFLDDNFDTTHEWEITPMTIEEGDIDIPQDILDQLDHTGIDVTPAKVEDSTFIGPPEDDPIIDEQDKQALNEDPYGADLEHEINSGDFNNHSDVSAFGS